MENVEQVPLSLEKAVQLVKDVFISAAERDVYTGDALKICIITKEGVREEIVPLRKDWDVFSAMPHMSLFFSGYVLQSAVLFIFLLKNKYVNPVSVVFHFECFVGLRTAGCPYGTLLSKMDFLENTHLHIDSTNGEWLDA